MVYSWQEEQELRSRAQKLLPNMSKRVDVFRVSLESYHIPPDGIEKYAREFTQRWVEIRDAYTIERTKFGNIVYAAEIIIELATVELERYGEVKYEELTPLQKDYLNQVMKAENEIREKVRKEYLEARIKQEQVVQQSTPRPEYRSVEEEKSLQERLNEIDWLK